MTAILVVAMLAAVAPGAAAEMVLAHFDAGVSEAPGWRWGAYADRVMGGRSEMIPPAVVDTPNGRALRLAGKVITRGGGFIQVRLEQERGSFDASGYAGVEMRLSAPAGGNYFVFVRTRDNLLPWSYYGAPLHVKGTVIDPSQTIRIPWSAFSAESALRNTLRPNRITSVALVAAFEDFDADLKILSVGLYR